MGFLGERDLLRRRFAVGAYASGVYTKGAFTDVTIRGTFRPMPARQVQLLEEGDREKDPRVLYTQSVLFPTSQHDNQPPDLISKDGGTTFYEVLSEYEGDEALVGFTSGVTHRKYALLRVQEVDG